jgi:hypothetical protein
MPPLTVENEGLIENACARASSPSARDKSAKSTLFVMDMSRVLQIRIIGGSDSRLVAGALVSNLPRTSITIAIRIFAAATVVVAGIGRIRGLLAIVNC